MGDRFFKVVPLVNVRTEAPQFISGSALDLPASNKVATKLFQLNFLRVREFFDRLNTVLNPLGGGALLLDKANAALVTDTVSNLQRLELLVQALDKPIANRFTPKFYILSHGSKASDVVQKINALLNGELKNQIGTATNYTADDRTNQVIVMGDA